MRLVVDANILVGELIRGRGRELIARPELELYIAESAWEEACHELSKRIAAMVQKGVFSSQVGQDLLADAIALAEARVSLLKLFWGEGCTFSEASYHFLTNPYTRKIPTPYAPSVGSK